MTFEAWGFHGLFFLAPPNRAAGYALLALSAVFLAILLFSSWDRRGRVLTEAHARQADRSERWEWFLALILLAPVLSQVLLFRIPLPAGIASLGLPKELAGPVFSLLGAIPWMLAAGYLGVWQAVLIGGAAGLARAGWESHSLITPFLMALEAGIVAALVRQNFREWIGRLGRQPLVAAMLGGLAFGILRSLEVYASSPGTVYDGLDFTLIQMGPILLAAVLEAGIAGVAGQVLRTAGIGRWLVPSRLKTGPYNRSLVARMLSTVTAVGVLGLVVLVSGQWYLARSSVRDLVEVQMRQTAQQAGEGIPFFIQSGRASVRRLADEVGQQWRSHDPQHLDLVTLAQNQDVFERLAVFGGSGDLLAVAPTDQPLVSPLPLAFDASLKIGLQGVPQEVVFPPAAGARSVQLVFLAPVTDQKNDKTVGVVAGWAVLDQTPLLAPVLGLLDSSWVGETYLVDSQGTVLFHPQGSDLLQTVSLPSGENDQVVVDTAPDGSRQLEYAYAVQGYPWRVVVTVPQRVVDRMAMPIASRLLLVVTLVGFIFLGVVYAVGQHVTQPVRQMASTAEAIARGDLQRSVPTGGEDEVGRLATSFERMRRSLKARLEAMDLLLAVSQTLASGIELEPSLAPVLEGLRKLTGADIIRLVAAQHDEGEGDRFALQAGDLQGSWERLDSQILDLCRDRGHFTLENPTRARAVLEVESVGRDLQALMAFPIRNEDQYMGALWLAHAERHVISPDDVNLIAIVGAQIGVWLANVNLYHRVAEQRQRLSVVLESTPDAVLMVDRVGRLVLANPAAEVVLTGRPEEALGRPAADSVAIPEVLSLLQASEGEHRTVEIPIEGGRVLTGASRDIEGGEAGPSGRVVVLWDVTHYKRLDMLKSEFVATVSHDLRAPLTLMRGYSTMISMVGPLNDQQKDFVGKILDSVDQMGGLVENLLDLGRIEAGIGLNIESFQFEDVLDDVVKAHRAQAVNKRIALDVQLSQPLEPMDGDPTLLRQAMANLIDNAIKYTQSGGEVVVKSRQQGGRMTIMVQDTGMGISPADQTRLFEKFYRARRQESLKEKGSGLGLAIVKSIIEQHGGTVSVESRLGAGSTFTIEMPVRATTQKSP